MLTLWLIVAQLDSPPTWTESLGAFAAFASLALASLVWLTRRLVYAEQRRDEIATAKDAALAHVTAEKDAALAHVTAEKDAALARIAADKDAVIHELSDRLVVQAERTLPVLAETTRALNDATKVMDRDREERR